MAQLYNKAHTLTATLGRDNSYYLSIKEWLTDNAISLVGSTLVLNIKTTLGGTAVLTKSYTNHTDAPNGISVLKITDTDMNSLAVGNYYYELSITTQDTSKYTITISDFIVSNI